jgi:hypothetical protein
MNPIRHDPPALDGAYPVPGALPVARTFPVPLPAIPAPETAPPPGDDLLWEELGYFTEEQLQALLDCLGRPG